MFRRHQRVVGLDIGHTCLKAVLLEKNADTGELTVRNYAIYRHEETGQPLSQALRKLLRQLKTRTRQCAVAFYPEHAVLRFVERSNSEKSSPRDWLQSPKSPLGDLQGHLFDYCDLGESPDDPGQRRFLVCACQREEIQALVHELEQAGLDPVLIQLTPMALSNAFHFSREKATLSEPYLAVDIGAHQTHISGGHSDQVLLLRTLPWGAKRLLDQLAQQGITIEDHNFVVSAQADLPKALGAALEPLARELQQSADFLQSSHGIGRVDSIHLSGYLSTLAEFSAALSQLLRDLLTVNGELGTQVEFSTALSGQPLSACALWNPFQRITASDNALVGYKLLNEISRLPAAAGAALQFLT